MPQVPHPSTIGAPPLLRDGFPEYAALPSPASSTDFSAQVQGQYFERLLTVWCRFVADNNAANREVVLQFQDAVGNVYRACGAAATIPADGTFDYSFSVWQPLTEFPVDSTILVPLDPILIPPTFKWSLHIVNKQAGDAISRVRVYRERFWSNSPTPGIDRERV